MVAPNVFLFANSALSGHCDISPHSVLFYSGLDMKFKGIFHPIIISPIRVPELFKVTQRSEGMCVLVLQLNLISVSFIGNTYINEQKVFLIVLVVTL